MKPEAKKTQNQQALNTHIKDFKPCNVKDADEMLSRLFGVELLVYTNDHPQEHLLVDRFSQSPDGIINLQRKSTDILTLASCILKL